MRFTEIWIWPRLVRSLVQHRRPQRLKPNFPGALTARLEVVPFPICSKHPGPSAPDPPLDFAVVIVVIVAVAMAQILHRAQGAAVGGVANFDPAIYVA